METTTKTDILKRKMIESLTKTLGVVSVASKSIYPDDTKAAETLRKTHYQWLKDDPNYKNEVESIDNIAIDFVESQNYKLIKELNPTAIIFYLKTKGRKRGYQESLDHTTAGEKITGFTLEVISKNETDN